MDNKLANPGGQGNDLGKAGSEILADPYITAYDNGINRAVNDKEPETTMSAQVHQAKRQSPRKLRTMSGGSMTKDVSNTQGPLVPHHCHCLPPPQLCWTAHGQARQIPAASSKKAPSKPSKNSGYCALSAKAAPKSQAKSKGEAAMVHVEEHPWKLLEPPRIADDEEEEELISSQDDYNWEEVGN